MGEWQDISTAPRDGTPVLVWNGFCGAYVSRYFGGEWAHAQAHFSNITGFDAALYFPVPTHWMPLPCGPDVPASAEEVLPCDVMIAPRTLFRKGVKLSTMLAGLRLRATWPEVSRIEPTALKAESSHGA